MVAVEAMSRVLDKTCSSCGACAWRQGRRHELCRASRRGRSHGCLEPIAEHSIDIVGWRFGRQRRRISDARSGHVLLQRSVSRGRTARRTARLRGSRSQRGIPRRRSRGHQYSISGEGSVVRSGVGSRTASPGDRHRRRSAQHDSGRPTRAIRVAVTRDRSDRRTPHPHCRGRMPSLSSRRS